MADVTQRVEARAREIKDKAKELDGRSHSTLALTDLPPAVRARLAMGNALTIFKVQSDQLSAQSNYYRLQAVNIVSCPADLDAAKSDPSLKHYPKRSGEVIFHGGGTGFLGKEETWQRECAYDSKGALQLGPFEGSLNQWDATKYPLRHTFDDLGGIVSKYGFNGFYASMVKLLFDRLSMPAPPKKKRIPSKLPSPRPTPEGWLSSPPTRPLGHRPPAHSGPTGGPTAAQGAQGILQAPNYANRFGRLVRQYSRRDRRIRRSRHHS
jgi:hypothetical protein